MIEAVSTQTMRQSDKWTIEHLTFSKELMYRAGKGIYENVEWKSPVAIVCGKGNNAGDGFVVAKLLKENGFDTTIFLISDSFSEDGKYYYDLAVEYGANVEIFDNTSDLTKYGTILDCIFGTGFRGAPDGLYRDAINMINASTAYVVSADINSGLNGDSGKGECFVKSDLTVSIGSYKTGHFWGYADQAMKSKINIDIGIKIIGDIIYIDL